MRKHIDFGKIWPHIVAILAIVVVSFIYFSPAIEGKVIKQMDVDHTRGIQKELVDHFNETGEYAMWTNSLFGGMPAYLVRGSREVNVYRYLFGFLRLNMPAYTVELLFLSLLGFYVLFSVLGFKPLLSVMGSFAFAFTTYNMILIEAGHVNKIFALAFVAPVLAGIILTFKKKYIQGGILTAISLGLLIHANHLQVTYYALMIIGVYFIVQLVDAIKQKEIGEYAKKSGFLGVAVVLAILPNITQLWTISEYGNYSIRGATELSAPANEKSSSGLDKDYALSWSYGKLETFTLLIPNFAGGSSQQALSETSDIYNALLKNGVPPASARQYIKAMPTYWGGMPFISGPAYVGAIICFLFVLGLFIVKGSNKWWLLIATVLIIMLSWGKNLQWFTDLFFYYMPMYNKFRAVSSILMMVSITMGLLSFMAVKELLKKELDKKELLKKVSYAFYIVGGISLIFALLPGMFFDFKGAGDQAMIQQGNPAWLVDVLRSDRQSLLQADAFRSFIFILLTVALIFLFLKEKLKTSYMLMGIGALVLIDLWTIDKRYLNNDDFVLESKSKASFVPTRADMEILQDTDLSYRVANFSTNTFNDAYTSYFHKSIGGYHGAKLRRYQDLIERHIQKNNMSVLDMLNTKYVIQRGQDGQPVAMQNPNALGNAWFVDEVKVVNSADEEIDALYTLNPATSVVIDHDKFQNLDVFKFLPDSTRTISLTEYGPEKLVYRSSTSVEQLAVFSEVYYEKGWNAYVDGDLVPHFRVNYILRSMIVPAGEHTIEFKFEPIAYHAGAKIAGTSSLIVLLIILAAIGFYLKNGARKEDEII